MQNAWFVYSWDMGGTEFYGPFDEEKAAKGYAEDSVREGTFENSCIMQLPIRMIGKEGKPAWHEEPEDLSKEIATT